MQHASTDKGPLSYRNWRARLDGRPLFGRSEVPIYTDIDFSGPSDDDLGPYRLQHAFPAEPRDPALILFIEGHLDPSNLPDMKKTTTSDFTGALPADEIAALLSLSLGRRFMAGSTTRSQLPGEKWIILGDTERPMFFRSEATRRFGKSVPLLPRVGEPLVVTTSQLSRLAALRPAMATSIVRAARCYRDALWIAETEPELAWLLFVSALEVGSVQQKVEIPAIDILREWKPDLVDKLVQTEPALADIVANELSRELRATNYFLSFMERFMPAPPEARPPVEWACLDWSPPVMRKALSKIYTLRSKALHEGMPFPPPMCDPPFHMNSEWPAPMEKLLGVATASTGGVWLSDEVPMSLHSFEYIARGALLNWWNKMAE